MVLSWVIMTSVMNPPSNLRIDPLSLILHVPCQIDKKWPCHHVNCRGLYSIKGGLGI